MVLREARTSQENSLFFCEYLSFTLGRKIQGKSDVYKKKIF